MKNINKINILILATMACILLLCVNTLSNSKSSKLNQQASESQSTGVENRLENTNRGDFPTNKNGETYGKSILTEDGEYIDPDLIEAIGEDNIEGYVRYEDIY